MLKPLILLSLIAIGRASLIHNVNIRRQAPANGSNFDWNQVNGTDDLQWVPCYGNFECTRLNMPLDYSNASGTKAGVAIIRSPASVTRNSSDYKGPVLFNPGGPGASGVEVLVTLTQLGDPLRKRTGQGYDIVSFDPRGIAHSTPRASFFDTHCQRLQWWPSNVEATAGVSGTDALLSEWARVQVVGKLAAKQSALHGDYLQHFNTENTARDMLYITQKYGREKVMYYGTSYGSVLGYTFATMFPDKVDKLVIDGIADPDDYYSASWKTESQDIEKTLAWFYDACFSAGKSACPFWNSSATQIQQDLVNLHLSVATNPLPVMIDDVHYGVITVEHLRLAISSFLYEPYLGGGFPLLAQVLVDVRNGNGSTLIYTLTNGVDQAAINDCESDDSIPSTANDGHVTVECNDGASINDTSFGSLLQFYEEQNKTSTWADFDVRDHLNCIGWPKWPKTDFVGKIGGKTSTPLLVISNTADPVTPHSSGEKVVKLFLGSVLLTQNAPGHTSVSSVSDCTAQIVQAYFTNGTLPKDGTTCQLNANPPLFPGGNSSNSTFPSSNMTSSSSDAQSKRNDSDSESGPGSSQSGSAAAGSLLRAHNSDGGDGIITSDTLSKVIIGLLAGNLVIGIILLLFAVTFCVLRGKLGLPGRARSPYAPVSVKDMD